MTITDLLNRFERKTKTGDQWLVQCPAHEDRHASLAIREGDDGRILLHDHAGCDLDRILSAMSLSKRDLFADATRSPRVASTTSPVTVAQIAAAKGLPVDLLTSVGWRDDGGKIVIAYRDADGRDTVRQHIRTALRAKDGSRWGGSNAVAIVPYGLWRLEEFRQAHKLAICEGETDTLTLWYVEKPAIGIPGASMVKTLRPDMLRGFSHVLVFRDNDVNGAGDKFSRAVADVASTAGVAKIQIIVPPGGCKDVNDWYRRNPTAFVGELQHAVTDTPAYRYTPPSEVPASNVSTWPRPDVIQGELPAVEPFALDLLPVSFQPLVQDGTERMQVPMDYPAMTSMLCLAGAVSRRALMQPKVRDTAWLVTPNLWGAIVGPPGVKKTHAIEAITRPLTQIQTEWRETFEAALVEHERAHEEHELRAAAWKKEQFKCLAKNPGAAMSERPSEESPAPTLRRLIMGDATFEVMHTIMRDNPAGLLMIRDELTGWLSELERPERGGEREFCLSAWNGDTGHTIDRIGRGTIHVPHCCLSIVGGIQPGRLRAYLGDALRDGPSNDGLIQRFQLMVWPDIPKEPRYVDRAPDAVAEAKVARIFRRLVDLDAEHAARFTFSDEAQALFIDWFEELETRLLSDDLPPALASHLAKYRSLMPTLALLFELADRASSDGFDAASLTASTPTVSVEHAKQAAAWCAYLESHAVRIYSCVVAPQRRAARALAQRIKAGKLDAVFSVREVHHKNWSGLDSPEVIRSAAEYLQEAGWLRSIAPEKGPGRPSEQYEINPRVRA